MAVSRYGSVSVWLAMTLQTVSLVGCDQSVSVNGIPAPLALGINASY